MLPFFREESKQKEREQEIKKKEEEYEQRLREKEQKKKDKELKKTQKERKKDRVVSRYSRVLIVLTCGPHSHRGMKNRTKPKYLIVHSKMLWRYKRR